MKNDIELFTIQNYNGTIFGEYLSSGKVKINKGSFFRTYEVPSLLVNYKNKREYLKNNGFIDEKKGVLIKDYIFDNPSEAICTLNGNMESGIKNFYTIDNISLGDYLNSKEPYSHKQSLIEKEDESIIYSTLDIEDEIEYLPDYSPISLPNKAERTLNVIERNPAKAKGALLLSNYKCNINSNHESFISRNNHPYMEAHHLIPISAQDDFNVSLDVDANIVCLCPNCHKKLHYGNNIKDDLYKLYSSRKELLKESGIDISFEELLKYYK